MKARARLERTLQASRERMQEEVSALLGIPFKMGEPTFRLIDKEALFEGLEGRQVLAHVKVDGEELEGQGCLLVAVKDAIHIGGRLIMLPDSELKSVISAEDYSDELQDSFGEVANILCGSLTYTFEEQFPKNVRFIRTEQETVLPAKVEAESAQPIINAEYLVMSMAMEVDNQALGTINMVIPAAPFGLAEALPKQEAAEEQEAAAQSAASTTKTQAEEQAADARSAAARGEQTAGEAKAEAAETAGAKKSAKRDVGKQKKLIDGLLKASMERISDEVSGLLGGTLQIVPIENKALSKADFLEQAGGKQVMARMEIRGGRQGEAYLFVDIKTAIHLGGTLIMLPDGELDEAVRNEAFGEDTRDAYGEIANIIAGGYTAVFEEQSPTKLGFTKTEMETVTPVKVDPDSDDVFVNQGYYLSLGQLRFNGKELGRLQMLVPVDIFELAELLHREDAAGQAEEKPVETQGGAGASKTARGASTGAADDGVLARTSSTEPADILIFSDDEKESQRLAAELEGLGYAIRIAHFKEPVASVLGSRVQLVFLVMEEVNEQGFGVAIKLGSTGLSVPLIAAGPAWTRSLVLKAVKYGASDILVTPSTPADIRLKLEVNLVRRAA